MTTLVNPTITIQKPVKNKARYYYTCVDENKGNVILIKARDFKGKSRGVVGVIYPSGMINACESVKSLIVPEVKSKIDLLIDLLFKSNGKYKTTNLSFQR